jgi:SH3-like domain-containing protein
MEGKSVRLKATMAAILIASPAIAADIVYRVSPNDLNIRNGLGVNHQVVGRMPAGTLVTTSNCVPRDDGISGAPWCEVTWQGIRGWAATSGLLPINAATTPTTTTHVSTALDLWVFCAANPDTDPGAVGFCYGFFAALDLGQCAWITESMTVGELGRVYIDWASKHQGSIINMKAVPAAFAAMSETFNCTTPVS